MAFSLIATSITLILSLQYINVTSPTFPQSYSLVSFLPLTVNFLQKQTLVSSVFITEPIYSSVNGVLSPPCTLHLLLLTGNDLCVSKSHGYFPALSFSTTLWHLLLTISLDFLGFLLYVQKSFLTRGPHPRQR